MSNNPDRLYELLPSIYRLRDAEQGYPLKALLRVIGEQVDVVEDDIRRLYDNWFIETCADWVVPYIGDLVGYRPVHEAGEPGNPTTPHGLARNKILIPRQEVANTIRYRRRKGTLALLEELARDVTGWPTRAVEFYKLLGWTQNINHLHLEGLRARTVNLREGDALDHLDGPFDQIAHTVDVRRINSRDTRGRYSIPSVGLFVCRLRPYSITQAPPHHTKSNCYTFSVLGQDGPLYTKAEPETEPTHIAEELNLPVPIRLRAFEKQMKSYYGEKKSLAIWAEWAGHSPDELLPVEAIIAADLTGWQYEPPLDRIAVDSVLGRIAFPEDQPPSKVRVSYHYGFSADIGGGEYNRQLSQPQGGVIYRVGAGGSFERLTDAIRQWRTEGERDAVIEIVDNGTYAIADSDAYDETVSIKVQADHSLQIRAVNGKRPVVHLSDQQPDLAESLRVMLAPGGVFTLDGLLITGGMVHVEGYGSSVIEDVQESRCPAELMIRHCTLVPGWMLAHECKPAYPTAPSLKLVNVRSRVSIEHSIVGSIEVTEDEVSADPILMTITDSILDAADRSHASLALSGSSRLRPIAHVVLTIKRCTVFGIVEVHAIELAENCIFNNCLNVARRQLGCMRFCYVHPQCRTPRRYNCQPDLAENNIEALLLREAQEAGKSRPSEEELKKAKQHEQERLRPQFNSSRYGAPTYCQLADNCAGEIKRGADDESEMGVFHDLFQPQREANLRARLEEYTPAEAYDGIIYAS